MDPERIQFIQRHQNKPTTLETRVGNRQSWFIDDALTVEQDVEVDCARAGSFLLIPSERSFNLLKDFEEALRGDVGFNLDYPVEEPPFPRIGLVTYRLRFIQERHSLEP